MSEDMKNYEEIVNHLKQAYERAHEKNRSSDGSCYALITVQGIYKLFVDLGEKSLVEGFIHTGTWE